MRDVLPTLRGWSEDGRQFALATVVRTHGSAPREVGSVLGVREDGAVCGSVSGGCLDAAVVDACQKALASGVPARLRFARDGDELTRVHLMCGGESEVWVDPRPLRDPGLWYELVSLMDGDKGCVLATRIEPFAQTLRRAGEAVCCSPLDAAVAEAYRLRQSGLQEVAGEEWFFQVLAPRPRLVVIGAVHISRALVGFASALGFETVVIDPRTAYAQFDAQPDKVVHEWPQDALQSLRLDDDTYAVALTHDPKIDDAALEVLLRSGVAYVGALGSKVTQEKRKAALREKGLTEEQLARIHGPVGLDIGAENPEEIALAVIAEIVKVRRGRG
jgi:xanthine dehydrogenase accessory factor